MPLYLRMNFFVANKELLRWINRILALLALVWLIKYFIRIQPELINQPKPDGMKGLWLIPVFMLGVANWALETIKWKYLISSVLPNIKFSESLKSVLAGVTLGVFSPNRTGEVLGRVFSLPFPKRFPGFVFHACGSFSQFTGTLLIGGSFSLYYGLTNTIDFWTNWGFITTSAGFIFFMLMLFPGYLLNKIDLIVIRWGVSAKEISALHRNYFLLPAILISMVRFAIYSLQLTVIWKIFDGSVPFFTIFTLVTVMFLAVSVIPSMAISEIGIRGAVLVHLAESSGLLTSPAVLAAALLWVLNVALPAILGIIPLQNIEWFQSKK